MKIIIVLFFVFLTCMLPFRYAHADNNVVELIVTPFFAALQSGDLNTIQSYVSGDMQQKMTGAFEQDKNYGTFLKQRYDGAIFNPAILEQGENRMIVSVETIFQEKGRSTFNLIVQQNSTGIWQIIDQYSPPGKN